MVCVRCGQLHWFHNNNHECGKSWKGKILVPVLNCWRQKPKEGTVVARGMVSSRANRKMGIRSILTMARAARMKAGVESFPIIASQTSHIGAENSHRLIWNSFEILIYSQVIFDQNFDISSPTKVMNISQILLDTAGSHLRCFETLLKLLHNLTLIHLRIASIIPRNPQKKLSTRLTFTVIKGYKLLFWHFDTCIITMNHVNVCMYNVWHFLWHLLWIVRL